MLLPGQLIAGRYFLEEVLGHGGMATVWRATDTLEGGAVALKVLSLPGDSLGRFEREVKALAALSHPNVVRYLDHGTLPAGMAWIAMEWLRGEDLQERLFRGALTVEETLTLAKPVARALVYLHARGLVHRDLKPANHFLPDGDLARVRVLDFGLVRPLHERGGLTQDGALMGTPGYMAPEQARGSLDVDARADVWAFGSVLFECLSGRELFPDRNYTVVLARVLFEDPPRLASVWPEAPAALDELIASMVERDPDQRPRDGGDVLRALEGLKVTQPGPGAPRAAAGGLGTDEQRVLNVIVGMPASVGRQAPPPGADLDRTFPTDVYSTLQATVKSYGGRLEALLDGSLVVGIPGPPGAVATDQAALAARCALALSDLVPSLPLALATGRGRFFGSWPIGEVLDRATALLRAAPPDTAPRGVRIDRLTATLLTGRFGVALGSDGAPLLVGSRHHTERTSLTPAPVEFVGRERELRTLTLLAEESAAEPLARPVLVTGSAGLGKSRLRLELLASLYARDTRVLTARADPLRSGSPRGLAAALVRDAAGLRESDSAEVRERTLRTQVGKFLTAPDRELVLAFLGELVDTPLEPAGNAVLAARRDRRLLSERLQAAFVAWLRAECARGPVALVLEDLHWADAVSVRWLDAALEALEARPLFVLALSRPEVHERFPNLWASRGVQELRLGRLTRKACERMVTELLGPLAPDALLERLVSQADGHPFYLEELCRAVREGREDALPASVLAMTEAMLLAVEPEGRQVLRAASLLGLTFWRGALVALLSGAAGVVDDQLTTLCARGLVLRSGGGRFAEEPEYGFRHALLREAAYATLTAEDRALGHRLAAEWLERQGETDATLISTHLMTSDTRERAIPWLLRAASQCLGGNDLDGALARTAQAEALGASGPTLGALRLLEADIHDWRGAVADTARCATDAWRLLPYGSAEWFDAAGMLAVVAARLVKEGLLAELDESLRAALEQREPGPEVLGLVRAVAPLFHVGRYPLAQVLLERLEAVYARGLCQDAGVWPRLCAARALKALVDGDPGAYRDHIALAMEGFAALGDERTALLQRNNLGYAHVLLGDWRAAEGALRTSMERGRAAGLVRVVGVAQHNLGLALARLGRFDEAEALEREALATFERLGDQRLMAGCTLYLALILGARGAYEAAVACAREAVALYRDSLPNRAFCLAALADALLAAGQAPEALLRVEEAWSVLQDLGGMEEGEALLRVVRARCLHAAGRREEALAAVLDAQTVLEARAAKIAAPEVRALFLSGHPEHVATLHLAGVWRTDL
ncbi:MAG: protein kinase [Deltaproteobacteria bacterium]|nr:protein kinase [Deltaproteobacteria bacterium]